MKDTLSVELAHQKCVCVCVRASVCVCLPLRACVCVCVCTYSWNRTDDRSNGQHLSKRFMLYGFKLPPQTLGSSSAIGACLYLDYFFLDRYACVSTCTLI